MPPPALAEYQIFWYKRLLCKDLPEVRDKDAAAAADQDSGEAKDSKADGSESKEVEASDSDWKRLMSLFMQLRKVCNHPYQFSSAEPIYDEDSMTEQELKTRRVEVRWR